ncbi:MAG: hypothetical protein R3D53_07955 [Paracoccaceae bacterium]
MLRRILLPGLFVLLTAAVSGAVWRVAVQEGLRNLQERGAADLRLASDRLVTALVQFREVAVLTADHRAMRALAERGAGTRAEVDEVLQRVADRSGALELLLVAPDGRVLAGPPSAPARLVLTPELRRARHGATGTFHYVEAGGCGASFPSRRRCSARAGRWRAPCCCALMRGGSRRRGGAIRCRSGLPMRRGWPSWRTARRWCFAGPIRRFRAT